MNEQRMADALASPVVEATAWGEFTRHWRVLAGSTLGVAFGASALPFYTSGLFIVHFEREFGWSRSDITLVGLSGTVITAFVSPFAGSLMDRYGIRWFAAVSFLGLALSFFGLSMLSGALWAYAVIHIMMTLLAPGSSPIAFTRPVNTVFDRMRGLALGITIGGIGTAAALGPPLVGALIEDLGWRDAYLILAGCVLLAAPIALFLTSGLPRPVRVAPTRAEARAAKPALSPVFWRLAAVFLMSALAVSGFVVHLVPMLTDSGVTQLDAAKVAGTLGLSVLVGRVGVGFLMDRVFAPYVGAGLFAASALGLTCLVVGGTNYAVLGAIGIGLAMGAEGDIIGYMAARYFGMAHYGRIFGLFYSSFLIGSGFSPYLISRIHDVVGYSPALWAGTGLLTASVVLLITAPPFADGTKSGRSRHLPA